jgi:hypothetical protein
MMIFRNIVIPFDASVLLVRHRKNPSDILNCRADTRAGWRNHRGIATVGTLRMSRALIDSKDIVVRLFLPPYIAVQHQHSTESVSLHQFLIIPSGL